MRYKSLILTSIALVALIILFFGIQKQEKIEIEKAIEGLKAPDISLRDQSGRDLRLSDLKGKVVFINFWASWCQPCRDEMPSLQVLYNGLRNMGTPKNHRFFGDASNDNFRMLTILYRDDPNKAISFLRENNLDLPLWIDRDGKAAASYGLTGVPETFIIDKKGILRKKVIGPANWASPEVLSFISELIKE